MSLTETEKNRALGTAKNVQLTGVITPHSNGGSSTPIPGGYVSEPTDISWVGNMASDVGRAGIDYYGDQIKASKEQAKELMDAEVSKFDLLVNNIQRNPDMSASEKEIRVQDAYNQYAHLPASKKHEVLNAHGAGTKDTERYMAEKAGKEQRVAKQVSQNEMFANTAIAFDPSSEALPFSEQIKVGKRVMSIGNKITSGFDHLISLGQLTDEQSRVATEEQADALSRYCAQLWTRQERDKYFSGNWTQADTFSFINNLSNGLMQRKNPITGTTLSKQAADYYANMVGQRMFANMDEKRLDMMKKTKEYQDAYTSVMRNDVLMAVDPTGVVVLGDSPEARVAYWENADTAMKQKIKSEIKALGTTENGHTKFPYGISGKTLTIMMHNDNMPKQQADTVAYMTGRQGQQPNTLETNRNMFEMVESLRDGYFAGLSGDYLTQNEEQLHNTLVPDIQLNIQSLVQARIEPQAGEGWFQRAVRNVNNVVVGSGTTRESADSNIIRGANAQAINDMLNQYSDVLRRKGVREEVISKLISDGIAAAGIPVNKGPVQNIINAAIDYVLTQTGAKQAQQIGSDAVDSLITGEKKGVFEEKAKEEPKEEVIPVTQTPEYREKLKELMGYFQKGQMTEPQVRNELNVFAKELEEKRNPSKINIKKGLYKVGKALSKGVQMVAGVKTANAAELNSIRQRQNTSSNIYSETNTPEGYDNSGDKPMSKVDILLEEYYKAEDIKGEMARYKAEQKILDSLPDQLTVEEIKEFYDILLTEETDETTHNERLAMSQDDRQLSDQLADRKKRK